jgi:predicted aspartyl protease
MITKIIIAAVLSQLSPLSTDVEGPRIGFSFVHDSLVVIPVLLNGQEGYRFLLDTGATNSILSSRVADRLGVPEVRRGTLLTAGGNLSITIRVMRSVQIGSVRIKDMEIAVAEAELFRRLHIDGIIGADYLKQFKISIDYTHQLLSINP